MNDSAPGAAVTIPAPKMAIDMLKRKLPARIAHETPYRSAAPSEWLSLSGVLTSKEKSAEKDLFPRTRYSTEGTHRHFPRFPRPVHACLKKGMSMVATFEEGNVAGQNGRTNFQFTASPFLRRVVIV